MDPDWKQGKGLGGENVCGEGTGMVYMRSTGAQIGDRLRRLGL